MSERIKKTFEKEQCKNLAVIKRYWPGNKPDQICVEHAEDSKHVANAMGLHLVLEPITYSISELISEKVLICCCSAGFSQKVTITKED